ncbi:hypothetical protein OBBRIDRAFT_468996 [Obba rivulosa]|uniref:Uncharacterized protein n=1 Tax=Obba rivulosa TaxID=1052685 RepID=A0A8E2DL35_9APHY|nr:hypothetical protein OBBRIDRAFT_468996 [Obba rivulosa]
MTTLRGEAQARIMPSGTLHVTGPLESTQQDFVGLSQNDAAAHTLLVSSRDQVSAMQAFNDMEGSAKRRQVTKLSSASDSPSRARQEDQSSRSSVILNPEDPSRWPTERILFTAGFLLFPCWIVGGLWNPSGQSDTFAGMFRWRCQVMGMIACYVIGGLIVVESVFKGK